MQRFLTMIKGCAALILLLAVFSCKKTNQPGIDDTAGQAPLHAVNFTMTGVKATTTTLSTSPTKATNALGDTLKNYASYLYYRIYNANGIWIKSIDQKSTDANFGSITDRLAAGNYKVFVAASKTELRVPGKDLTYNNSYFGPLEYNALWPDAFSKAFDLSVGNTDLSQTIRLERAVAGCQIVLPDGLPKAISQLKIQYQGEYTNLPLVLPIATPYEGSGLYKTMDLKFDAANYQAGPKTFTLFIANTATPIKFILSAYNSAGIELLSKNINNVLFERNKMTTLTGNLFPANSVSADFVIGINPYWTDGRTEKF